MAHAAPFDSSVLVGFATHFCGQPVEDVALVHLGGEHRARDVAQIAHPFRATALRNDGNEFLFPYPWPYSSPSYLIIDIRQWDGKQRTKLPTKADCSNQSKEASQAPNCFVDSSL